jgi:hypothetical protein
MKNDYTRFDFYLSYWILVWVAVYFLLNCFFKRNFLTNRYTVLFIQNCNPMIAVIIALIFSISALLVLVYKKAKPIIIFLYMLIVIVKSIPIYFLWGMPLRLIPNVIYTIVFILVYGLYLRSNGHTITKFYKNETANIMKGNTPLIHTILTNLNK